MRVARPVPGVAHNRNGPIFRADAPPELKSSLSRGSPWIQIFGAKGGGRKFTQNVEYCRLRNCDERTRLAINTPRTVVLAAGSPIRLEAGSIAVPLLDISNEFFFVHRLGINTHFLGHFPNYIHSHKHNFLICIFTMRRCGSPISPQPEKSG